MSQDFTNAIEKTSMEAYDKKDLPRVKEICDNLVKNYSYLKPENVNQMYIYASNSLGESIIQESTESPSQRLDAVVLALKTRVERGSTYQVHNLDGDFSFADVKKIIAETAIIDTIDSADSKLPFFISKEIETTGNITSCLNKKDKRYTLYEARIDKQEQLRYSFIGDSQTAGRPVHSVASLSVPFYTYKFLAADGGEYLIFSIRELTLGRHKVSGMVVAISDRSPFGDTAKFSTLRQILMVHTASPDVHTLTQQEAESIAAQYDGEAIMQRIRGGYKHPAWFEKFLIAWVISGKDSGYPLHLVWLSEAGGGKTKVMYSLYDQFQELQRPEGIGTLKGLVPNFGGTLPDEGYLCKCQRFGLVDEFFAILRRSSSGKEDNDSGTSLMLAILEHQTYQGGSGKHQAIIVKPSMRALFCSNMKNYYGFESMFEISQHMSNAFMSRMLWYVQTPAHMTFVNALKSDVAEVERESAEVVKAKHDPDFVCLVDWFNSFILPVRSVDVEKIYSNYETKAVPDALAELYRARSRHHIACLIDGIAKANWIFEKRAKLEILPSDVEEANSIFGTVVLSWTPENALSNKWVPINVRLNYLSYEQRKLYDLIGATAGIDRVKVLAEKPDCDANLGFLVGAGFLELKRKDELGEWYYECNKS